MSQLLTALNTMSIDLRLSSALVSGGSERRMATIYKGLEQVGLIRPGHWLNGDFLFRSVLSVSCTYTRSPINSRYPCSRNSFQFPFQLVVPPRVHQLPL